jgi:putative two-component system response regulator
VSHHEQWCGRGYPHGLKETDIPLQGRIMAIADVFDALVSERPYKKAFTCEEAIAIIMDGAGKQFDPNIATIFSEIKGEFENVFAHSCK